MTIANTIRLWLSNMDHNARMNLIISAYVLYCLRGVPGKFFGRGLSSLRAALLYYLHRALQCRTPVRLNTRP